MPNDRNVSPGPRPRTVRCEDGEVLEVPHGWELLPPGDGPLTRLVKVSGPSWQVREQRGRRLMSRGVWADARIIEAARAQVEAKRADPQHAKSQRQREARRELRQQEYREEFYREVLAFLDFHPRYEKMAGQMARVVTEHATPIGSGTVARTTRIPVAERARAAVVAWMRHRTTDYERMRIARRKGERRLVRRQLAERSLAMLEAYRRGEDAPPGCRLARTLKYSGTGL